VRYIFEKGIADMVKAWDWKAWGPWMGVGMAGFSRPRFFEFGEVRIAILSLLSEGPKHGYQLMKEMKERSGGVYQASAGSVYPTLQQLEDEGLIESEPKDGKRVYKLTAAGKKELEDNPESAQRIWERAESWEDWGRHIGPEVMAMFGPLGELIKASIRASKWAAGRPEREDRLRAILTRACRELDELAKK
jgi:DNA-binding PadR family transcriptional regulator